MRHCVPILAAALALSACAQNPAVHSANRMMQPGSIVGQTADGWDTPAVLASGRAPLYPVTEFLAAGTGCAEVEFDVSDTGVPGAIQSVWASKPAFGHHLAAAAQGWRFEPATKDGHAVPSHMHVAFSFFVDHGWESPTADYCRH